MLPLPKYYSDHIVFQASRARAGLFILLREKLNYYKIILETLN